MSILTARPPRLSRRPISLQRRVARFALLGLGWVLVAVGLVGAILPGHLGVPVFLVGLIVVLRTSRQARRQFIGLQRRHPRFVFPIRRLLRREPEVAPVLWHQLLRTERFLLPPRWRRARQIRRRVFTKRPSDPSGV